jgi:hypothetical protein
MALWSDTRFALRQLRKSPGFTLIVIGTLALCIGVNTAVFSVLDAVLLRGAPYPEPDRLAVVVTANREGGVDNLNTSQTGALFEAVRDHVAGLDVAADGGPGGANFAANQYSTFRVRSSSERLAIKDPPEQKLADLFSDFHAIPVHWTVRLAPPRQLENRRPTQ